VGYVSSLEGMFQNESEDAKYIYRIGRIYIMKLHGCSLPCEGKLPPNATLSNKAKFRRSLRDNDGEKNLSMSLRVNGYVQKCSELIETPKCVRKCSVFVS